MIVDLTPEDLELLQDALDEQLRKARAVWSIYGLDRRDHIADVKALRAKLSAARLPK